MPTFIILAIILWTWAIFDISKANFKNKALSLWIIPLMFFLPVIGPIIYFQFKGKMTKKRPSIFE